MTKSSDFLSTMSRLLVLATFLLSLPCLAWGAVEEEYFGIYLPSGKVGYMHVRKDTGAVYAGKPAVCTENETQISISVLGNVAKTVSKTVSYNDPKTGAPLATQARSEAAGRVTTVSATYADRTVSYVADIQGSKKSGTLTLKPGESFLSDPSSGAESFVPKVGMEIGGKTFVAETLRLADEKVSVLRKESVVIAGAKSAELFVVQDRSEMGTVTMFVTPEGETLLLRFALGMEARKEPKNIALRLPSAEEISQRGDLAIVVGITPTGEPVKNPRTASSIRYKLRGSTGELPVSDNRQGITIAGTGNDRIATLAVTAKPLPSAAGMPRFARTGDAPADLRPFLSPSDYVSSDDPAFAVLAKDATDGETDLAKASARIADFVHRTIVSDSSIAVLRTASDINKDRRGVCREYTTFFTAIARNAGIPTRVCVGVVLVDGAFVYHAWPEVWVGPKNGWVALEPTWGRPFADATHIKLAQGEITDLYRVADDMGRYKIEVLK
ncbi:MAG: transglutaminase domain-containing protein [Akkermansiaceae bacterium]|nr:transglutaminase domain-containing protein [Armatimonadota bacterium]